MNKYTSKQLDEFFDKVKDLLEDPQHKLRAIELRGIIDYLYPREEEVFKNDFAEVNKRFVGLNERIKHIEECLGIDFELDNCKLDDEKPVEVPTVDYSFIQDVLLRQKVDSYYREMLRYQYATRNHKQCFGEFCRLAIMQVEFVLNYAFSYGGMKDKDINDKIDVIAGKEFEDKDWSESQEKPSKQDYIKEARKNKAYYVMNKISFKDKSKLFFDSYLNNFWINKNKASFISRWTANMRNRKSHGGANSIDPYEYEFLSEKEIIELKEWRALIQNKIDEYKKNNGIIISFTNDTLFPWKDVPVEIRDIYYEKNELAWVSKKNYFDVHKLLRIIASTCAKELKKNE